MESEPRSGRPATARTPENVERVRIAINKNRRLTVRELEEDHGIPKTIVSEILTQDLGMSRVAAKFVPRLLTQLQKNYRVEVAQDNLETIRNNLEFLKKVITGDESWSTAMTLRQKPNLFSGRRQKNNDRRKRVKIGAM